MFKQQNCLQFLLYNLWVINQSQCWASITASLQVDGKISRAHTSCLYPNTKEELNADSVCIHSDRGTRQVSGLYFQSKAQKVPWNIQLWQLFGILLPLWMHHCNKYPEDLPKKSRVTHESPHPHTLWIPSTSEERCSEKAQDAAAVPCHRWGLAAPAGSHPKQQQQTRHLSQNCCLMLSWLWD